MQWGVEIRHAGMLRLFLCFPNDADRFIFVDVNKTHPIDDRDKIVLFLAKLSVSKMT